MINTQELCVLLMRANPPHVGHIANINSAIDKYGEDNVVVLIGSAQAEGTLKNPFSYEFRRSAIWYSLNPAGQKPRFYNIFAISDLVEFPSTEHDAKELWCNEIIRAVEDEMGRRPTVMMCGTEVDNEFWYGEVMPSMGVRAEFVDRQAIPISATMVRGALLADDKEAFLSMTPNPLHDCYEFMRSRVLMTRMRSMKYLYILDRGGSRKGNDLIWWKPEGKGYTRDLLQAGLFSEETVEAYRTGSDLFDHHTVAIPKDVVDKQLRRFVVAPNESSQLELMGIKGRI